MNSTAMQDRERAVGIATIASVGQEFAREKGQMAIIKDHYRQWTENGSMVTVIHRLMALPKCSLVASTVVSPGQSSHYLIQQEINEFIINDDVMNIHSQPRSSERERVRESREVISLICIGSI
jgi:hypothetical protein